MEQAISYNKSDQRDFLRKAFDFTFLVYTASMCGNKTGVGFDAIFCRATFVLFVIVALFDILRQGRNVKVISGYTLWLYAFITYVICSLLWCSSVSDGLIYFSRFIQYWVAGTLVIYRVKTRNDVARYLCYAIIALMYMCILLLIRTPPATYWNERIGSEIGQHPNAVGRFTAYGCILCGYFIFEYKKLLFLFPAALFIVINLMTGSRLSFIILVFGVSGYLLLAAGSKKLVRNVLLIVLLASIAWYIMMENETVYLILGRRMEGLLAVVTGNGVVDGSTLGRINLRYIAKLLFARHPLFGVGINNYMTYLRSIGYWQVTYAHNNYWELLASLGAVGATLYYSFYAYLTVRYYKLWRLRAPGVALGLSILLVSLVADYGGISYTDVFYLLLIALLYANLRITERNLKDSGVHV